MRKQHSLTAVLSVVRARMNLLRRTRRHSPGVVASTTLQVREKAQNEEREGLLSGSADGSLRSHCVNEGEVDIELTARGHA